MSNYKERVVEERNELDLKLNGLYAFVKTDTFHNLEDADQDILNMQLMAMDEYLNLLEMRIKRFKDETDTE